MLTWEPSTFERVRQLQDFANSFVNLKLKTLESKTKLKSKKRKKVFPHPLKKGKPLRKGWLFYNIGEDGEEPPFTSKEKQFKLPNALYEKIFNY